MVTLDPDDYMPVDTLEDAEALAEVALAFVQGYAEAKYPRYSSIDSSPT
jgi:hypothetical protein